MIESDLAIILIENDEDKALEVVNLKKINQKAVFKQGDAEFMITTSTMSKANTYKAMYVVEKNKDRLIR